MYMLKTAPGNIFPERFFLFYMINGFCFDSMGLINRRGFSN